MDHESKVINNTIFTAGISFTQDVQKVVNGGLGCNSFEFIFQRSAERVPSRSVKLILQWKV